MAIYMQKTKIKRIVIWGLKKKWHTHRFIHKAFYENAKKLKYNVMWLEDEKKNSKYIESGDLIISAEVQGKMVPEKLKFEDYNLPIKEGVYYCLHNYKNIFKEKINKNFLLNLQVYTKEAEKSDVKLGPAMYFDTKSKTLYQPWGTDLLLEEFKKPVFNKNNFVFWVGSIWNDSLNQGNLIEIENLKKILQKNKIKFINVRFVPDFINKFLVRISRIAPAIAGKYQVDVNYLPCRMFKNISYGQLGFSNVKKFNDILGEFNLYSDNMEEMINKILSLKKEEYKKIILGQQEIVKNYTYKNSLKNILDIFSIY